MCLFASDASDRRFKNSKVCPKVWSSVGQDRFVPRDRERYVELISGARGRLSRGAEISDLIVENPEEA